MNRAVIVPVSLALIGYHHVLFAIWTEGSEIVLIRLARITGHVYVDILSLHSYVRGYPFRDEVLIGLIDLESSVTYRLQLICAAQHHTQVPTDADPL